MLSWDFRALARLIDQTAEDAEDAEEKPEKGLILCVLRGLCGDDRRYICP
jgi:hypothetical protein